MNDLLFLYFFIELILLVSLFVKYQTPNSLVLSYFVFFLYAQANYMDYLLTGEYIINLTRFKSLDFRLNSESYFKASTYYFSFLFTLGFFGLALDLRKILSNVKRPILHELNFKNKIVVFLLNTYVLLYHFLSFGMDRVAKKDFSLIPFDFIIFYVVFYLWGFELIYSRRKNYFFYFMTFVVLLHTIYSFEREYIVLVGLFLLFNYKKHFKKLKLFIVSILGFFIITLWKQFYINVIIFTKPISQFFKELTFEQTFSTGETTVGMSLLTNYFNHNIYQGYYFSYLTNLFNQFTRIFFDTQYLSLGELSTRYYTNDEMGTAFSMILESILNFGFLGPIILAFLILIFIKNILKKHIAYYDIYSVFVVFIMIKLVRTELAVIIKLYLLPFMIFILINKFFKIQNKLFSNESRNIN